MSNVVGVTCKVIQAKVKLMKVWHTVAASLEAISNQTQNHKRFVNCIYLKHTHTHIEIVCAYSNTLF